MLGELITSKTRLRLLIKFFISQANRGYLNGLANEMGEIAVTAGIHNETEGDQPDEDEHTEEEDEDEDEELAKGGGEEEDREEEVHASTDSQRLPSPCCCVSCNLVVYML